jgi:prepilin-type N-terminal cleavage/methylation domain-containing protein
MSRAGRNKAGFTLPEVMIALGILTFGMLAILSLVTVGVTSHRQAIRAADASLIATTEISELRHRLDGRGQAAETVDMKEWRRHPLYPDYYYKVTAVELDKDGREVYVRVAIRPNKPNPRDPLDPESEVFESIILRRR